VDLTTPAGLASVAEYAYGIGADKDLIVPRSATGRLLAANGLVHNAHQAGLVVHAWTFRAENRFLPLDFRLGTGPDLRGDGIAEYEYSCASASTASSPTTRTPRWPWQMRCSACRSRSRSSPRRGGASLTCRNTARSAGISSFRSACRQERRDSSGFAPS
jgi:hypothetical protein